MIAAIRTGAALAIAVAIGYALRTLVFRLWPESAATFMNGLFHGVDFRRLQGAGLVGRVELQPAIYHQEVRDERASRR